MLAPRFSVGNEIPNSIYESRRDAAIHERSTVQVEQAFGEGHFYPLGVYVHSAEVALSEGNPHLAFVALHDEQRNGTGAAIHVRDIADAFWRVSADLKDFAADQVGNVDFIGAELRALSARNGDNEAGERFRVGDGGDSFEVEDDAALVQPMVG